VLKGLHQFLDLDHYLLLVVVMVLRGLVELERLVDLADQVVVVQNMELRVVLEQIILVQLNRVFQEEMDLPLHQHMVVVEVVELEPLVVMDPVLLVVQEV
tara:strand:+ start:892 stop:1191 length:300 start_codon:yes stop_codon:yes gene_type:complete